MREIKRLCDPTGLLNPGVIIGDDQIPFELARSYSLPTMRPKHENTVLERKPALRKAVRWCVVFHNDDYTTKWFVVQVLTQFFRMDETTATQFMLAVHRSGRSVAGMYPRDVAETKAAQVMDYAREWEMPLLITTEPDDDE